jgi:hypothetical protein
MGIKKIKFTMVNIAAVMVLGLSSLVALTGVSYASDTISWTGQGADSVKACDTGQTPYLHWIFTTGGNSSVTAADLTVGGQASGGGAMSQHGGSWTLNTAYSGTAQPTTSTVTASVAFTGSLGNGTANLVISDGCFGTGGEGGGPTMDCDGDFDNSPQSECTPPQPQKDCDGDFDNSPASECVPVTGGQGGGPTTTTTGQVLAANTSAPQVAIVPQGSVNGGEGAASSTLSNASVIGLFGSLLSAGAGLALLNRRQG